MSEAVARAVGSDGPTTVIIAGKECSVRPLKLKELGEIERECVKQWKRSYLETYSENADLLPITDAERVQMIRDEMNKIATWDVKNLPAKYVVDVDEIPVTEKLEAWVRDNFKKSFDAITDGDRGKISQLVRQLAGTAIDQDLLSKDEYKSLTGTLPEMNRVGYANWWISGTMFGMLEMIYTAFKHNGVTRDEVNAEIGSNVALATQLSREIEGLTAPQLGN